MKKTVLKIALTLSTLVTLSLGDSATLSNIEEELEFIKIKQQEMILMNNNHRDRLNSIFRNYHSQEIKALRGWLELINESDHNTRYFLTNSKPWIKYVVLPKLRFEMSGEEFTYLQKMINIALSYEEDFADTSIMKRYIVTTGLNLRRVPLLLDIVKKEVFKKGDLLDIEYSLYHHGGEWGYIKAKRGWVNMRHLRGLR